MWAAVSNETSHAFLNYCFLWRSGCWFTLLEVYVEAQVEPVLVGLRWPQWNRCNQKMRHALVTSNYICQRHPTRVFLQDGGVMWKSSEFWFVSSHWGRTAKKKKERLYLIWVRTDCGVAAILSVHCKPHSATWMYSCRTSSLMYADSMMIISTEW